MMRNTAHVRRILVGYDGSPGGRRALERAITEARAARGRITVLSVADIPLDPNVPRNFGSLDDISAFEVGPLAPPPEIVGQLTDARDLLGSAGFDAELTWAAGRAGRSHRGDRSADSRARIVLGEHHHGALGRFFGADVDAEVQRQAGCDVILA